MSANGCSHAVTKDLCKIITAIPADEQAFPHWQWRRTCVDCGEYLWGDDLF